MAKEEILKKIEKLRSMTKNIISKLGIDKLAQLGISYTFMDILVRRLDVNFITAIFIVLVICILKELVDKKIIEYNLLANILGIILYIY